jgi:hypothetical protein
LSDGIVIGRVKVFAGKGDNMDSDTIVQAIIIAASTQAVNTAFEQIKSLLIAKFGAHSPIVQATNDLGNKPQSLAHQQAVQKAAQQINVDKDLQDLVTWINSSVKESYIDSVMRIQRNTGPIMQGKVGSAAQGVTGSVYQGTSGFIASGTNARVHSSSKIVNGRVWALVVVVFLFVLLFAYVFHVPVPRVLVNVLNSASQVISPVISKSKPEDTLVEFCNVLRMPMPPVLDAAYRNIYSDSLRQQVTPEQFYKKWASSDMMGSCTERMTDSSIFNPKGTITKLGPKGPSNFNITLVFEDGIWKIDSVQP